MEMIRKADAPLYVDVNCAWCRRPVALSNTVERKAIGGVFRCCERCNTYMDAINPPPVCERLKPYQYNGFEVTHYNLGKEQFIANKRACGRPKDLGDLEAIGE